jgi:hypothetical protein
MQNQGQAPRQSQALSKRSTQALSWTPDEQSSLAVILGWVFDLQKQYGKTTEQANNIVAGFCWALGKYPISQVVDGIQQYILNKSDMPTPADIRQIIDPIPESWRPDWAVYNRFKKLKEEHGPYALSQEEIDYMIACENHSLASRSQ